MGAGIWYEERNGITTSDILDITLSYDKKLYCFAVHDTLISTAQTCDVVK